MCYSALVLAMMFSMGEPLPYHHYGKSGLCLSQSWCWHVWGMLADMGKGLFLMTKVGVSSVEGPARVGSVLYQ